MDSIDRDILHILQRDNLLTNEAIARRVGLSDSAVRRRIARLRSDGVIIADVSLLDPARIGLTAIVSVSFNEETKATYDAFKRAMCTAPEVSQCYTVSGEVDVIVVAHMRDLAHYEAWMDEHLVEHAAVRRAHTNIVYSRVKYETAIDVKGRPSPQHRVTQTPYKAIVLP